MVFPDVKILFCLFPGPLDAVPSSTADWAMYEVPDEIKQAFLFDKSHCAMNKQTITCAGLTVFYLLVRCVA